MKSKIKFYIVLIVAISLSISSITAYEISKDKNPTKASITKNNVIDELKRIPKKYEISDAKKNGDIYMTCIGASDNYSRLDKFIKNVQSKKADKIRIVNYTIEGDPIISILSYSNNKILLTRDTTRDAFGAHEIKQYKVIRVCKSEVKDREEYYAEIKEGKLPLIVVVINPKK